MAYLKPPWFTARIFNPLAMRLGRMQTLEVKGRRSGRPQRIPVIVPDVDGIRYLVSTRPLAGKVVEGYWRQLPDDADHPVFALTPN
ncbi:hypothetical protein C6A85_000000100895 [Mycobacterium sp. ITM-2017-0098]|nr:hypothetical protein C6A85_000000100895 [Mycobacterium sp. ITM-2017-0098]